MATPNQSAEQEDFDFEKELNNYIESEEKTKKENQADEDNDHSARPTTPSKSSTMDRSGLRDTSDNEDSEVDDYNLTEDQKRALEELDNLKSEMGYPDEDPPEYDVKERLKVLNEDLKNDPTPLEKQKDSKVVFKSNLVDLVAPPPDYPEESAGDNSPGNPKNKPSDNKPGDSKPGEGKTENKTDESKVDENSETISGSKKSNSGKKDQVLIEIDGQFQLVSADDVRARDLGYAVDSDKTNKENEQKQNDKNKNNNSKLQPAPPGKPRPATATAGSRRNVRAVSAKQRPQSAHATHHGSGLEDFNYDSPYALSPREKQLMEERKKAIEKQRQEQERRKKEDQENKEKENREAFEFWLKKKRESDRRKKINDEEQRKKDDSEDRSETNSLTDGKSENEEAFKGWLKEKNAQFKKEKLLKRRQDQEMHDGYYIRSRDQCDKAFKSWLKQKAIDARKARANERQKAKLQRLAARRSRKSISLSKSIRESNSFRYVDYYGYRF